MEDRASGGGRRCAIVRVGDSSRARAGDDSHHGVEHVVSIDEAQKWRRHVGGVVVPGVARVGGSAERIREPFVVQDSQTFRNR